MFNMPFDIWQNVVIDFLETESQLNLTKTNIFFNRLYITNLMGR